MPDGVRDKFEAPLKRGKAEFSSSGSWHLPRWDRDRLGVGGVRTPTTGPNDHRNHYGEKIKEGIEGGEDKHRDFKRASYVARITPPMPPRGQQRKGMD
jgi:hypothetical protein